VILDSDIAVLYGVETRDINKAVKNNPAKFPEGYIFELDNKEFGDLRWKISTANLAKTRVLPKAFTKKGCYMLATILKSPKATQTTIAIIEAFDRVQEMSMQERIALKKQ
jgi:phage regulator Rha-like protein